MSSTTARAMKVAARPGASGTSIFRSSSAATTSLNPFCIWRGEMTCGKCAGSVLPPSLVEELLLHSTGHPGSRWYAAWRGNLLQGPPL